VDFGIGKGYRHNEFAGFCVPQAEADERFEESIAVMRKAWTSDERWSHHGTFWNFEDVVVEPPTAQKPHPPIWMGAGSEGSIRSVAQHGFGLLIDQYASVEQVGQRIGWFRDERRALGLPTDSLPVGVTRSLNVVLNEAERDKAVQTRIAGRERVERLARNPDGENRGSFFSYAHTPEAASASALYGTPDEIAAKLEALRDVGADYLMFASAGGIQSLRRFARELMPAFSGSGSTAQVPAPA
jgi:alkanesulfonate monooxygenase SsuD/methylene tetrahydromethanopterin reductase-like flavin-dependent oxidoreductase (luciferase family)